VWHCFRRSVCVCRKPRQKPRKRSPAERRRRRRIRASHRDRREDDRQRQCSARIGSTNHHCCSYSTGRPHRCDRLEKDLTKPNRSAREGFTGSVSSGYFWQWVLTFGRRDPRRARIVFSEALGSEALAQRRSETLHLFAEMIAEQGRAFYGVRGNERLADTTAYMLAGGLAELMLAWRDGTIDSTLEQLIEDCTELFVATGEAAVGMAGR